jgi:hypothetical protein
MDDTSTRGVNAEEPRPTGGTGPTEAAPFSRRWRLDPVAWIALGIVAVVVVATAIVLVGNGKPAQYPSDSPEAAVQGYLRAWYDKDYQTAYGYFTATVKSRMSLDGFISQQFGSSDNATVSVASVSGSGDRRTVVLDVEEYYGPGSSYERQVSISMLLENGAWRINEALVGLDEYYSY